MRVKRLSPMLQYALVALVGVAVALLATMFVRRVAFLNAVDRLDRRAEQLAIGVEKSIEAKLHVLEAFQAFYAANGNVDAEEFTRFAIVTLSHHHDVQALQWLPYVPGDALEAFETFGKSLYGEGFFVKERGADDEMIPVAPRDYYFPILYTEPLAGNESVIGLDGAFEPTRRAVVEMAWHSGKPSVSSPIRLVQETGDQMAVLVYQPIYDAATVPVSLDERRASIVGLVPVVLRTGDFLAASLAGYDTSGFNITLTDALAPENVLYRSSDKMFSAENAAFSVVKTLEFANQTWQLHFVTTTAQIESESVFSGIIAFVSVIVIDLMLIVYLWQRNRTEEALRGYATTLETTNSELDAFNHTIAHDLKHPLAIINGYAHLLTDEDLTPEGCRMLSAIPKVVDNMVEMVDGLLQLAKLRDPSAAGTPVDMNASLNKALARFDNSRTFITVDGKLPPALGHEAWMTEVFANLINNALKYTPEDRTPAVRVRGAQVGQTVRYEVSDNGIGIKPEDQQRIFEMFTRISDENHHVLYKGLGIGLSIVKRVIQRQGGEVGVTSTLGDGSTFWFTLPAIPEA